MQIDGRKSREKQKGKFNKHFQSTSLKTRAFLPWNITVLCQLKRPDYLPSASENRQANRKQFQIPQ